CHLALHGRAARHDEPRLRHHRGFARARPRLEPGRDARSRHPDGIAAAHRAGRTRARPGGRGCAAGSERRTPPRPWSPPGPSRRASGGATRYAAGRAAVSSVTVLGTTFQNPVLLAAGTAGFGRELVGVIDLEALGGLVTKAVTPEPRRGHPGPRVAALPGGMLNAIGLANPGLEAVATHDLPWLANALRRARVIVNVAGATIDDYERVLARLDGQPVVTAVE